MTPRPRSRDKTVPISIGLPNSLLLRLDNELHWKQSRSKWVKSAILAKLNDDFDYGGIPSKQLLGMLLNRGIIKYEMFKLLCQRVEEIEVGQ